MTNIECKDLFCPECGYECNFDEAKFSKIYYICPKCNSLMMIMSECDSKYSTHDKREQD